MSKTAEVILWGNVIGIIQQDNHSQTIFQYDPDFAGHGIEVSPLSMPLRKDPYVFKFLPIQDFESLPPMLASSLPDAYGDALMQASLAQQGIHPNDLFAIDKLKYMGKRGMGALEYNPATKEDSKVNNLLDLKELGNIAALAEASLANSESKKDLEDALDQSGMEDIISIGMSAGGKRPKALISLNRKTNQIKSGHKRLEKDYEHWMIKFDIKDSEDQTESGPMEYAYYLMAKESGINIMESDLYENEEDKHFITKRFDREGDSKVHMQTLASMRGYDFQLPPGTYNYEQVFSTIRELNLSHKNTEEQFRRMVFNILARNHDDHIKNISFIMNKKGEWSLSPAYDLCYKYTPGNIWTGNGHQLSLNNKVDNFNLEDIKGVADFASMKRTRWISIYNEIKEAVLSWESIADTAGVPEETMLFVKNNHRLDLK